MADNPLLTLQDFQSIIAEEIEQYAQYKSTDPLFEPIHYLLKIGGKECDLRLFSWPIKC